MCSLGIEPTTFRSADAMFYHWATQEHIFHNIYYIFDQIDASLVSIRDFFQTLTFPKLLNGW